MRAVFGCVVALVMVVLVGSSAHGQKSSPRRLDAEASCEEQCRLDRQRDDATCEDRPLLESTREQCHESVDARLSVCLRICDD
jgi:hypothetical protein